MLLEARSDRVVSRYKLVHYDEVLKERINKKISSIFRRSTSSNLLT